MAEAIRRASVKFHVSEGVFILLAVEHFLKFTSTESPYQKKIEFFEKQLVSRAKNRRDKIRAKMLGIPTPDEQKKREEAALARARAWLEKQEQEEKNNASSTK